MKKLYLKELNEQQLKAVKHFKGPCMVYAGPGSGKTTVIIHRVGYLINYYNVEPNKILVISFTKAAANEMKSRFESNYNWLLDKRKNVIFGTFHSIFFRILRSYYEYNLGNILDKGSKYSIIKKVVKSLEIGNPLDDEFIKEIILDIGLFKSNISNTNNFIPNSVSRDDFDNIVLLYENYKNKHNKIDFDDMLTKCYELLISEPVILQGLRNSFQYILIDEFQDINNIQFEIIKLLSSPNENLFVVGDDDQSIYGFRGANPDFILEFDSIYKNAKKIILNLNYRSQENIIKTANRLISNNKFRIKKTILPIRKPGIEVQLFRPQNCDLENKDVSSLINRLVKEGYNYKDIAVIYRTNILSGSIVDSFLDNNIPFASKEKIYNIYEHWMAKDIICYLKSALNIDSNESLKRIINRPTRYITNKSKREAEKYHKDYITALRIKGELESYQIAYLNRLEIDLKTISNLRATDAISYIRKNVGYDDYIYNYCLKKHISSVGLMEVLDELEEMSSGYDSILQFINHTKKLKELLYKNTYKTGKTCILNENQVQLLTMHGAKGLEFKIVIIIEAIEGIIPHKKGKYKENIEEERRLFYVAITRAKEHLYIYAPLYKHNKRTKLSRFVREMKIPRTRKR